MQQAMDGGTPQRARAPVPVFTKRAFNLIEGMMLVASVVLVSSMGAFAHRWMWAQTELVGYRSVMRDLCSTVRAMRVRAMAQHRTCEMRIDAARGSFQVVVFDERPGGRTETVARTLWLPGGLLVSEAPEAVTSFSSGALTSGSIVVAAPTYERNFRLTIDSAGQVFFDEESTL